MAQSHDATDADPPRWFEPPESAHDENVRRIEEVNEALQHGKAVTLVYEWKHESRATVLYYDAERDYLIYSPFVEGRRRVFAYPRDRIGDIELRSQTMPICFAEERRVEPVEETQLYHAAYGIRPVESTK